MPVNRVSPHCKKILFCRHARASVSPRWGSGSLKPLPGGGGRKQERYKTTRKSPGHADDHHLTTMPMCVSECGKACVFERMCVCHSSVSYVVVLCLDLNSVSVVNMVMSTCISFTDMFNITNVRGKVAKFCIFKTVYRLGEDIIGTFTFSEGDIPCLQV